MKAIIGGTGVYALGVETTAVEVTTPYGRVSLEAYTYGQDGGGAPEILYFLPRHGKSHKTPPHAIPYQANMLALKALGVTEVYATCAVGSMNLAYAPGDLVVLTDFIDQTRTRPLTLFGPADPVTHVEMSDPYCRRLRKKLWAYGEKGSLPLKGEAVYLCTEGPRFESAAEIRSYARLGADVVGMTNVPEVVFAKEAGMHYAAVGVVTNWCTGIYPEEIALHDIQGAMAENRQRLTEAFVAILTGKEAGIPCGCTEALIVL